MVSANYNLSSTLTINATQAVTSLKNVDTSLTALSAKMKSTQASFNSFGAGGAKGLTNVTTSVTKTGASVDQLNLKSKALGTGFTQSAGQINKAVTSIGTPLNTTTQSALKLDTSFKQIPGSMRQVDSASASNTASLGRVNQSALGNIQSQTTFRAKLADTSQGMNQTANSSDQLEKSGVRLQDRIGGIVSRIGGMVFSITGMIQSYSEAIAMQGLLEQSQQRVQEATLALSQAIIENGASSTEAVRAQQELTDAQRALSFQNRVTMLSWQDMIPFAVLLGITSSKLASQHLPALLKSKQAVTKAAGALGGVMKSNVSPSLTVFGSAAKSADIATKPLAPTMVATSGALRTYTGAANTATVATNGLKFSIRSLLIATGIGAGLVAASIAFDAWQKSSDAASQATEQFSTVTKEATNKINPFKEAVDLTTESFASQVNQIDVLIGKYKEFQGAVIIPQSANNQSPQVALNRKAFIQSDINRKTSGGLQQADADLVNKLLGGVDVNKISATDFAKYARGTNIRSDIVESAISSFTGFDIAQKQFGTPANQPFSPALGKGGNAIANEAGTFDKFGARTDLAKNDADAQKNLTEILKQKTAALNTLIPVQNTVNKGVNQSIQEHLGLTKNMIPMNAQTAAAIENSKLHSASLADAENSLRTQNKSLVDTAHSMGLNSHAVSKLDAETQAFGGSTQQSITKLQEVNHQLTQTILSQGKYQNAMFNTNLAQQALQNGIVGAVEQYNNLLTSSIQNEQQTRVYDHLLSEHAKRFGVELPAGMEKTTKNMELLVAATTGSSAAFEEMVKQMEASIAGLEQFGAKINDTIVKGLKENGKKFEKETRKHLEDVFGKATMKEFQLDAKAKFKEKELLTMIEQDLARIVSLTQLRESIIDPNITFDKAKFDDTMTDLKDYIEESVSEGDISELTGKNLSEQIDKALELAAKGDYAGAMKQIQDMFTAPGGIGTMDTNQIKTVAEQHVNDAIDKAIPGMSKAGQKAGSAVKDGIIKGWKGGGTIGNEATGEKGDLDSGFEFPAPDFTTFQQAVTTEMTKTKTSIVQNATLAMTDFGTEMTTGFTNTQATTDTFVTDFGTRINQMSDMMLLETGKINEELSVSTGQWATNFDTFITLYGERINQMSDMMLLETGLINEELLTSLETWVTQFDVFIVQYGERINQMSDMMLLETGLINEELITSLETWLTQFDTFIVEYGVRINQMSDMMNLEATAIEEEIQTGIDTWQRQFSSFIENYDNIIDTMSDTMSEEADQIQDELQKGIDQWQRQIKSFISNFEKSIDTMSDTVADEVKEVNKELDKIKKEIEVKVKISRSGGGGNAYGGEYQTDAFSPQLLLVGEGARKEKVKISPAGTSDFPSENQREIDKGVIMVSESRRGGQQPIVLNETIIIQNSDGSQRIEKRRKVFGGLGSH